MTDHKQEAEIHLGLAAQSTSAPGGQQHALVAIAHALLLLAEKPTTIVNVHDLDRHPVPAEPPTLTPAGMNVVQCGDLSLHLPHSYANQYPEQDRWCPGIRMASDV